MGFNGELKRADDIGRRLGSFADFTANSILGEIEPEKGGGRSGPRCAMRSSDVGEWKQDVSHFQILGKVVWALCQEIEKLGKQAGVENGEIEKTVRVVLKVHCFASVTNWNLCNT